jgi:Holliday junction resolvase RusA-like endonuclease
MSGSDGSQQPDARTLIAAHQAQDHASANDPSACTASILSVSSGVFEVDVLGTPAPKGSNRAMVRGGRAVFIPGGSKVNAGKLRGWDANVRQRAAEALGERTEPLFVGKAMSVEITFRLARPAGHWGKRGLKPSAPLTPATKPDIDKLARSTLDSLIGAVFDDDSRIVRLVVDKQYAVPGAEGARIRVQEWQP